VGVGGHGLGPGGTDEWIQVGLAAFPGSASRLYYEVKRPRRSARYVEILRPVRSGERHRVMVLETSGARGWWQVRVDGVRVGRPVFLPGSHGRWYPIATAESWSGGALACNGFRYRFERVALAAEHGGSWQAFSGGYVLRDSPYRLVRRGASSFLALAR
jgi:hypothetical protein